MGVSRSVRLVLGPHHKDFHTSKWLVAQVGLVSPKMRGVLPIRGDGHGAIMEVMHGRGRILLSAIRPCRMDVIPWTCMGVRT